jgi:predicted enzyme related to lactoylglutathione lyase
LAGHPGIHQRQDDNLLKHIVYGAVFVSDQDRALEFYTNVLGLEKRLDAPTGDGPRFLTVGVTGQDVSLVLWPGTPGQGQPVRGLVPAQFTIETDDCRAAFDMLKARGVKFEPAEIIEQPWGLIARFRDVDGNVLQLRELHAAVTQH